MSQLLGQFATSFQKKIAECSSNTVAVDSRLNENSAASFKTENSDALD